MPHLLCSRLLFLVVYTFLAHLGSSVAAVDRNKEVPLKVDRTRSYALGDRILIECLNRTV